MHRSISATDSGTGQVIERWLSLPRCYVTDGKDIRRLEEDVNISAGVCQRQIAVVDLFAACSQRTRGQKRLRRTGGVGTSLLKTIFGRNPIVRGHPLSSSLVSDDFRSGLTERLIRPGDLEMIMRVEN